MTDSAALVPAPFFAPVRTGAGMYRAFSDIPSRRPRHLRPVRGVVSEAPARGLVYNRSGHFLADPCVGRHVNRYV